MSYGRFVGRVGALAVALGIGIALPVEAMADSTDGSSADTNASSAGGASHEHSSAAEPSGGTAAAGADSTSEARPALEGSADDAEPAATEDAEAELEADLEADPKAELEANLEADAEADLDTALDAEPQTELDTDTAPPVDAEDSDVAARDDGSELDEAGLAEDGLHEDEVEADAPALSSQPDADRGRGTAFVRADSSPPSVAELNAEAEQVGAPETVSSRQPTPEAASETSATSAVVVAPSTELQKPDSAAIAPSAPAASTKRTGLLAGLFSLLAPKESGTGSDAPAGPFDTFFAALQLIRRDLEKLFTNRGPTASPTLTSQADPAILTGSINAIDPENDRLSYTVVERPTAGTLAIDGDGNFTYAARADLAAQGGTDEFVVAVRDTSFSLNFWVPKKIEVPVTVNVAAPPAPVAVGGPSTQQLASTTALPIAPTVITASVAPESAPIAPVGQAASTAPMVAPMAMTMADDHQHESADGEYIDLATFGQLGGSDHTHEHSLEGGRTIITTEALVAYNNLRQFAGL
ncbi:MAG: hypothetical protein K0U76_09295, partial [Actinomycetia bacterium]|nr:hypothetical protein [Actinomycetes bacterium]MCH9760246.1 hypothetical protein [Actinomycetes bacterium]